MASAAPQDAPRGRLALVDGHSLLHRAYFALPPLSNPAGQPTHAVYGFLSMLFRLIEDEHPTHLLVALDRPGKTFRDDLFDAYKGQRPPMPDDLRSQEPILEKALETLAIPAIGLSGFEADDVIGTLSRRAADEGFDVLIVTGDRDSYQLIGEHVRVLMTRKGISELEVVDLPGVAERYGLEPRQLIDVKALMGDTSDNIPGIPGIGEKTAVRLIQQSGTLEQVLAEPDAAGGKKLPQLLREHADMARLSQKLARIDRDAPVECDWSHCELVLPDEDAIRPFFTEMGFRTQLRRYGQVRTASGAAAGAGKAGPTAVNARPAGGSDASRSSANGQLALDGTSAAPDGPALPPVETRPVADGEWPAVLAEITLEEGREWALTGMPAQEHVRPTAPARVALMAPPVRASAPTSTPAPEDDANTPPNAAPRALVGPGSAALLAALRPHAAALVGHGLKPLLAAAAIAGDIWPAPAFDTELAAYLLDPGRSSYPLEDVALRHLDRTLPPLPKKADDEAALDSALAARVASLPELARAMRVELQAMGLETLYDDLERPLQAVLARVEANGLLVDLHTLQELGETFAARIAALEQEIHELAGEPFNISSTRQLGTVLFDKIGLKPLRKTKTGYSTDADTLEVLAGEHPLPAKVLEYRGLMKLQGTYVEGLAPQVDPATGRIHTTLGQTVAATGRLSSVDPNLQNIPVRDEVGRQLRKAFVAPPGHLLVAVDYSQIELRLLAHFSEDARMVAAFREGADIHRQTAAEVYGVPPEEVTGAMRSAAKAVNFGIVYGISDFGLSRNLGISREEAKAFIERYFERYPGVRRYMTDTVAQAKQDGYVRTLTGRIRHLPEIRSRNYARRQYAERTAMNTPLQGTAADLIKRAMLRADAALSEEKLRARMVLQVHDELIFETPEDEVEAVRALAVRAMVGAAELRVPLEAEAKAGPNWYDLAPLAAGAGSAAAATAEVPGAPSDHA